MSLINPQLLPRPMTKADAWANTDSLRAGMKGLYELTDPGAARMLIWNNTAKALKWFNSAGAYQPLDATLTALAALDATAGLLCQTGADAFARRTLIAGDGVSILNPTGAAGNPTLSVDTVWGDARYAQLAGATFTGDVAIDKTTPKFQALHDGNTDWGGLGIWDQAQNHGMYLYMFGASHATFPNQTALYSWNATDVTKKFLVAEKGKGVSLYYNGVLRFETLVNGSRSTTPFYVSSVGLGKSSYMVIDAHAGYFPQANFRINGVDQGLIYAANGSIVCRNSFDTGYTYFQYYDTAAATWKTNLRLVSNGGVELYYEGVKKAELNANGFQVSQLIYCGHSDDERVLQGRSTRTSAYTSDLLYLSAYEESGNGFDCIHCVVDEDGTPFDVFRVRGDGRVLVQHPDNDNVMTLISTYGVFSNNIFQTRSARTKNSGYTHIQCYASGTVDKVFEVRGDGNVTADGSFAGGGADRAEMFEWEDGNPAAEDRAGRSVVLVDDKIRLATVDDDPATIFSVITATPDSVGNAEPMEWKGKYERDKLGRMVTDKDGKPVLSAAYDSMRAYTPRTKRPEWAPVALLGRVLVRKDQALNPAWRVLKKKNETVEVLITVGSQPSNNYAKT